MNITVIAAVMAVCTTSAMAVTPSFDSQFTGSVPVEETSLEALRSEIRSLRQQKEATEDACVQYGLQQRIAELRRTGLENVRSFHAMTGQYPESAYVFLGENYKLENVLLSIKPEGCDE